MASNGILSNGISSSGSSSGTVTSVSVVSANGLAGTVATATTTPAITLSTTVTGILSGNGTTISAATATGSGSVVLATSPTLVTPILGTPTSGVATNLTGTATGLTAGTVTTNANLTGPITSSGNATAIASQTGTGTKFVVDTSPTLVTPNIGTPSAGVLTNCSGLPVTGSGTGVTSSSKGSLIVGSGSNTNASLAVGANGFSPTASSNATNGLSWTDNNYGPFTITSTNWLIPPIYATISTKTLALGIIYFTPFIVSRPTAFTNIGFAPIVVTNISYKVGVYNDSGLGKPTGTVITNSTATFTSLTTAAVTSESAALGATLTLEAGRYWFAILCDTSTGTVNAISANGSANFTGTQSLTVPSGDQFNFTSSYAGGLVDMTSNTCTRTTNASTPLLGLQVQ